MENKTLWRILLFSLCVLFAIHFLHECRSRAQERFIDYANQPQPTVQPVPAIYP